MRRPERSKFTALGAGAERIKDLYDNHQCRGVALTFSLWHIEEIQRFGRLVLPLLEEMGLWVSPHKRGWTW